MNSKCTTCKVKFELLTVVHSRAALTRLQNSANEQTLRYFYTPTILGPTFLNLKCPIVAPDKRFLTVVVE